MNVLVVDGASIVPIEIKLGASIDARSLSGLRQCMSDLGLREGWVVSTTSSARTLPGNIHVVPWNDVVRGRADFGL